MKAPEIKDLESLTGPQLVALFNQMNPDAKPIKRFADRKTAIARIMKSAPVKTEVAVEKAIAAHYSDRGMGQVRAWADPKCRQRRSTKNAVDVDGMEFGSVRKAFKYLGLPDKKHQAFRRDLKAAGSLEWTDGEINYFFSVIR